MFDDYRENARLADELIERLNRLIGDADVAELVGKLIATRADAGGAIADHPTIQVCDGTVGFLGLLNGIVGVLPEYSDRAGWGFISAEIDEAGRVLRFVRTGEDDD